MKPRIAITYSSEIDPVPYAEAVRASGGEPVFIALDEHSDERNERVEWDGLLLAGGVDVNPALYGEERHAETEEPNDLRDARERKLLTEALERDAPVVGICRGLQVLNVLSGGSLIQHREEHEIRTSDKSAPAHLVTVSADSNVGRIYGTETIQVNSRHHQAIGRVAEGLRVVAQAPDGTVEALESTRFTFVLGVQWHPEDMAAGDPIQKRLFDELVSRSVVNRRS